MSPTPDFSTARSHGPNARQRRAVSTAAFIMALSGVGMISATINPPHVFAQSSTGQSSSGQSSSGQPSQAGQPSATGGGVTVAPEVVVTATRIPTAPDRIGSSVTTITAEEIAVSGAAEVSDILRRIPSVSVVRNGGPGQTTSVRMRGATNNGQVLVLVDGVPITDTASIDNGPSLDGVLLTGIDRIEVLRGSQSALYGSSAVGGVINIITEKGEGETRATLSAEGGSNDTFRQSASVSGQVGQADFGLSVSNFQTDGYAARAGSTERLGSRATTVSIRGGADITDSFRVEGTVLYSRNTADFLDQDFMNPAVFTEAESRQNRLLGRLEATYTTPDGGNVTSVRLSGTQIDRDSLQASGNFSFLGNSFGAEIENDTYFDQGDVLTVGAGVREENAKTGGPFGGIKAETTTSFVFGQYLLAATPDWDIAVGGRLDSNNSVGAFGTVRVASAYRLTDSGTTLRGSVGTGARMPSLYQLFDAGFGNPDLTVERSVTFDAGIEQTLFDDRLLVSVTGFRSEYTDLIAFQGGGFVNVDNATVQGVETAIEARLADNADLTLSYTYTDARNNDTGQRLPRIPYHKGFAEISVEPMTGLRLAANADLFADFRDVRTVNPGWVTVGARVDYDIVEGVTLYARGDNLFDRDIVEAQDFEATGGGDYLAAGRTLFAGVRATF